MGRLPIVRDHMDPVVHTLRPETDIYDAVDFLLDHRVTGAPVVDARGTLVGIVTEKDCLRLLAIGAGGEAPRGSVADYMTREVTTVSPNMDIYFAAGVFLRQVFRRVPVVEDGRLVGAITRFDILRAIQTGLRGAASEG